MNRLFLILTTAILAACSGGAGGAITPPPPGSITINTTVALPVENGGSVGGAGASCNPSTSNWPTCTKATVLVKQAGYITNPVIHIPAGYHSIPFIAGTPNTEYILDGDITANSTAITVTANYVVINLNGYTITYNQVSPGEGVNIGAWNKHDIAIVNGSIIQGAAKSEGSQTGGGNNPVTTYNSNVDALYTVDKVQIANLYVRYGGKDVGGIMCAGNYGLYEENTIEDTYDYGTLKNRHAGIPALTASAGNNTHYNIYRNNTIKNCRHRGIDVSHAAEVYGNKIDTRAIATNAYGIFAYQRKNVKIYNNTITARGEHSIGIGVIGDTTGYTPMLVDNNEIYNNYLDSRTTRLGTEYGGFGGDPDPSKVFTGSGATGFRTTWGGNGINFHDNVIIVRSSSNYLGTYSPNGAPARLRSTARGLMVMLLNGEYAIFQNNTITALDDDGVGEAKGIAIAGSDYGGGGNNAGLVFKGNKVTSNIMNVSLGDDYGAAPGWPLFIQNTFIKSGSYSNYATIGTGLGGYNVGTGKFVSNIYQSGATETSFSMNWGNHNTDRNAWKSIMFGRLMTVTVKNGIDVAQSGIALSLHNQTGDTKSVTYNVGAGNIYVNGVNTFTNPTNSQMPISGNPTNTQVTTDSNGLAQIIVYDFELNDIGTANGAFNVNRVDFLPHSIGLAGLFTLPTNSLSNAWDALTSTGIYKYTWDGKAGSW